MLAVSTHNPLSKKVMVRAKDLKNETMLLLEEGHCLRDQALSFCHRIHVPESLSFRATSIETLKHMAASNVGVTLIPQMACKPQEGLCYLPFDGAPPSRTVGMLWRKSTPSEELKQKLCAVVKLGL